MIREYDHLFKIVIVGSQGVGKSGIFLRFCDNHYFQNYTATIGVDFKFKTIEVDNNQCKLQIWDTAGQQRFRTITSAYYKGAQIILIVHDLSNIQSFNELEGYWIEEVKLHASPECKIAIIGSKSDLTRGTETEMVQKLADGLGIKAYEVSAKTGEGITEAFEDIARDLAEHHGEMKAKEKAKQLSLAEKNNKRDRCC